MNRAVKVNRCPIFHLLHNANPLKSCPYFVTTFLKSSHLQCCYLSVRGLFTGAHKIST